MTLTATVVIASRNRASRLERCLTALARQETTLGFEVVVVDDGSVPSLNEEAAITALAASAEPAWQALRLVQGRGEGPARARNLGIEHARGAIVLFTDDDTIPSPAWLDAACVWLDAHPFAVGVEGPTWSRPFDPLFAHSVHAPGGGGFTCNVAYRATTLREIDGFYEEFAFAHGEDLDLAYRALDVGPIGFVHAMSVEHPPFPISVTALVREGRCMATQLEIAKRHPLRYPRWWTSSLKLQIAVGPARRAYRDAKRRGFCYSAAGWRRLLVVTAGQTVVGARSLSRRSRPVGASR